MDKQHLTTAERLLHSIWWQREAMRGCGGAHEVRLGYETYNVLLLMPEELRMLVGFDCMASVYGVEVRVVNVRWACEVV